MKVLELTGEKRRVGIYIYGSLQAHVLDISLARFSVLCKRIYIYDPLHQSETIMGTICPINVVKGVEEVALERSGTLNESFSFVAYMI